MPLLPAVAAALDLHAYAEVNDRMTVEERREVFTKNLIRRSITDESFPVKVSAFRVLFGLARHNRYSPAPLSPDRQAHHAGLHREEFEEYLAATTFAERVDGIIDLIYTLLGELLECGFTPAEINDLMAEVHASNLTKTNASGKPIFSPEGKVLKGDNYVPADIASLIANIQASRQSRAGETSPLAQ